MSATAGVLERLLAATPPPDAALEVDALLAAFTVIAGERDRLLAAVTTKLPLVDVDDRTAWEALEVRQTEWIGALASARARIGASRAGVRQLAAYHVRSDDGDLREVG